MYDQSSNSVVSSNLIISGECHPMFGEQDDKLVGSLKKFWESESVRIIPEDQSIHPDKQRPEIHLVAAKRLNNHGIVTNWEKLTVITASQVERGARFSKELWQNCSNKSRPESLKGFMIKNQAVQLTAAEFINHHTMQRSEKLAKQLKCKQFTTGQWKHLKKNCFWMTA